MDTLRSMLLRSLLSCFFIRASIGDGDTFPVGACLRSAFFCDGDAGEYGDDGAMAARSGVEITWLP